MANSPAHRFGQIIGDLLEIAMIQYCMPIADKYSLYLDYRHSRAARSGQNEVKWVDVNDNVHKLDIVIEDGGSEEKFGKPRAFIEIAWRRYTKHSKNKAQEISGAIKPLVAKYSYYAPFYCAVVAGDFTDNSLKQLYSEGFEVVYFSLQTIVSAFDSVGINAYWEESTPERELQARVNQYEALTDLQKQSIIDNLIHNNNKQLTKFNNNLCVSLERKIETIRVITVYGNRQIFGTPEEAKEFIAQHDGEQADLDFYKFEIYIKYTNGDIIEMQFSEKRNAILFLNQLI